ncbi:MAG: hypothetical protein ISR76_06250 [Planctomycetes bacterium]|nr:hypothetical protein [Planctomycetota bacterium]
MSLVGGLLVVVAAWLTGRALLPGRAALERSIWEESCLAYVAGCSALVAAAMLLTWAGLPFGAPLAWGLLVAGAGAGAWRLRRDRAAALRPAPGSRRTHLLLGALAAGSVVGSLVFPLNEFDAILHFALKGRALFFGASVGGPAFTGVLGDFGRIMTHPNYPLGIPFLEAFSAHAGFGWSERWVQLPLAFWSACIPGLVALGLRPWGARAAIAGALMAACTPMLVVRDLFADWPFNLIDAGLGADTMLGGRGDLALAATSAAACALLLRARRSGSLATGGLAGLCLAGGVLMKNEGMAVLVVVAIAQGIVLLLPGPRPWKPVAVTLAAGLLLAAPWLLHRTELPAIAENYAEHLTIERLGAAFQPELAEQELFGHRAFEESASAEGRARAAVVAEYFATEAFDLVSWALLWPLFLLAVPLRLRPGSEDRRWLALVVLGTLAAYALILLVTPWYLPSLRATGIPERLMLHLVGPAAMVVGAALAAAAPADRAASMSG